MYPVHPSKPQRLDSSFAPSPQRLPQPDSRVRGRGIREGSTPGRQKVRARAAWVMVVRLGDLRYQTWLLAGTCRRSALVLHSLARNAARGPYLTLASLSCASPETSRSHDLTRKKLSNGRREGEPEHCQPRGHSRRAQGGRRVRIFGLRAKSCAPPCLPCEQAVAKRRHFCSQGRQVEK